MVFKVFESTTFLKPEELKQSKNGAGLKILTNASKTSNGSCTNKSRQ